MASDKPPKPLTLLCLCQPGQVDAWGLPGSPPGYECLPQFKKCVSLQLEFQAALPGLMHHWRLCKSLQRDRAAEGEDQGFGLRSPQLVMALPEVILCVASGKALAFSDPPFPRLQRGVHEG